MSKTHKDNIHAELATVRDLIRYAVSSFNKAELHFGHGSDSSWDEAVYLVLRRLNLPLDTLEPFLDAHLTQKEKKDILTIIQKRIETHLPIAYLMGEAWLQGHRFLTDKHVIIPRSPISELLSLQLAPWVADADASMRIMDLCTGSGCLAILAALAFPQAQVDAVDISTKAIELAKKNVAMYGLQERINVIKSDLYSAIKPHNQYDFIICNPPYVNSESMSRLPREYQHEPSLALDGGADGMLVIRKILRHASQYLAKEGFLILEIGHEAAFFDQAFPGLEPIWLATENTYDQIMLLSRQQLVNLRD